MRVEHLVNTLRVSSTGFFLLAEDHFYCFPNVCCQWCFDSLYRFFLEILQIWCTSFYLRMIIGTRLLLGLLGAELSLISNIKALPFNLKGLMINCTFLYILDKMRFHNIFFLGIAKRYFFCRKHGVNSFQLIWINSRRNL